jgi:hypothetical protein
MPNKHLPMKLSRDEEIFLRHWIYDEAHYRERTGPAKRLQVDHRAIPADLGTIIAAAMPCLADQEGAALAPPVGTTSLALARRFVRETSGGGRSGALWHEQESGGNLGQLDRLDATRYAG